MRCKGCYKDKTDGYCLKCRKLLFDGKKVLPLLNFSAPAGGIVEGFQKQVKQLSISGVQLKYSLRFTGSNLSLTQNVGQYIAKPEPPVRLLANTKEAPENEHLTMQIARQVFNIETADNALIYFDNAEPAYLTRRFDVKADGTKYLQEDFAQLSGKTRNTHGDDYKYNGTYEDIGLLIKKYVAAAAPAMEVFFKIVLFNYLLSNGDAHLKNFSLIKTDTGEYRLTPAYDMLCTVLHTNNESDMALNLFEGDMNSDHYQEYGCYGYPEFMEFAQRIGLIEARAKRMIADMLSKANDVEKMVAGSFLSENTKGKYLEYYKEKINRFNV